MRNAVTALVSYAMSILIVFYCMLTYTMGPRWFTALSLVFGGIVTYCMTDLICRGWTAAMDARAEREEEEEAE